MLFSLWNGYHIYAVDGSAIQIPPSEENINFWGSNPNQYGKDEPPASASLLYDVMNGIIVDSYIGKYRLNEREAAERHMDFWAGLHLSGKHIFLFDRGYPSYDLFSKLMSCRLFFLMRLSSSFKNLINTEKRGYSGPISAKGQKAVSTVEMYTCPASRWKHGVSCHKYHGYLFHSLSFQSLSTY